MLFITEISCATQGNGDMRDLTTDLTQAVQASGMSYGLCHAFVVGSTASLTTLEFEPGLIRDLATALDRIAPTEGSYEHEARWGDDNGHSHIRASLLGPDLGVPFRDERLCLGTWQQAVLIDFDTRPRERTVIITIVGE